MWMPALGEAPAVFAAFFTLNCDILQLECGIIYRTTSTVAAHVNMPLFSFFLFFFFPFFFYNPCSIQLLRERPSPVLNSPSLAGGFFSSNICSMLIQAYYDDMDGL